MKKVWKTIFILVIVATLLPSFVIAGVSGFAWPVDPSAKISLYLGDSWVDSSGRTYSGHMGDDVIVPAGTVVRSAGDGEVVLVKKWPVCDVYKKVGNKKVVAQSSHGWGGVVVIKYIAPEGMSFESGGAFISSVEKNPEVVYVQYGHMDNIVVELGQKVSEGGMIAKVGNMCMWSPHLHFEIKSTKGFDDDINNSAGAGFGYSGTDKYGPDRYEPLKFVDLNKFIKLKQETTPIQSPSNPSFLQKIKSFLSSLFANKSEHIPPAGAEGESVIGDGVGTHSDDTLFNTTNNTNGDTDILTSIYDADILNADESSVLNIGQKELLIVVQAKNTGNTVWRQGDISTNVIGGVSANAPYRHGSWLTARRPTILDQSAVSPGETGTFSSLIRIPQGAGTYTFQLQLVRQDGGSFDQLGSDVYTVHIEVNKKVVQEDIPIRDENTVDRVIEKVKEKTNTVFNTLKDVVQEVQKQVNVFLFGGTSGSGSTTPEQDIVEEVIEDLIEDPLINPPTITITSPTPSPITLTTPTTTIFGTVNTSTALITVNGTSTDAMVFNTTTLSWEYTATLTIATNTFQFVAWESTHTTSTEQMVEIYYDPIPSLSVISPTSSPSFVQYPTTSISGSFSSTTDTIFLNNTSTTDISMNTSTGMWEYVAPLAYATNTFSFTPISPLGTEGEEVNTTIVYTPTPPTPLITSPTTSASYTTTTHELTIVGQKDSSIISLYAVIGDAEIIATSTATTSWEIMYTFPTGTTTVEVYGVDVLGTHSATTSLQIVIEEVQTFIFEQSDYYGQVLFSEIAWMGTSASPYDEWFELYIVTGSVYPLDGTIVAWGTYDTESGTFENEIILDLQEVFFQEDIFVDDDDDDVDDEYNDDDPFVSSLVTPQVFLFERTDDTTVILHNAFQIYTGGMNNNGEHLYLFDSEGKIIDEVDASDGWFAGDNVTKETMIRVHVGTDGNDESSWCSFSSCETEVDEVIVQNGVDAEGNVILGSVGYPLFVVIPMW